MRRLLPSVLNFFSPNKQLSTQLHHLLGYKPKYIPYYQLALTHRSSNIEIRENNERLEFLGDAFLGTVVAEYLYRLYPTEDEGFLTELRSKIVRRETLNEVSRKMGIHKLVAYNMHDKSLARSHIFGNALEALIGAVYLDKGFPATRNFILKQLLKAHVNVAEMATTDNNFKNQLLKWSQSKQLKVVFENLEEFKEDGRRFFTVGVVINDKIIAEGTGFNRKVAGQMAARKALLTLHINVEDSGPEELS